MKIDYCIISAGGKGSRIANITKSIPKPLYPINGISCLERTIKSIKNFNIKNIIISICFKSDIFKTKIKFLKEKYNINIDFFEETTPLGECGCIWKISNNLKGNILFLNSDLIWKIDLNRLLNFHLEKDSDITLVTHTSIHPEDSDLIMEGLSKEIFSYSLKPHSNSEIFKSMYLGNSGISLINSRVIPNIPCPTKKVSFCNHILQNKLINKFRVFSYNTSEYIKDMGTEKRLLQVKNDLKKKYPEKKCYDKKQSCLFLDRDNTLIDCPQKQYITSIDQLVFRDDSIKLISKIRSTFDLAILISNQPQISMGLVSWEEVNTINAFLLSHCLKSGLHIDAISICPHHPHSGYKNEIKYLKVDCFCRKPRPGLIIKEAFLRNIDLKKSLMIGDSKDDELAAKNAGINFTNVCEL